MEVRLRCRVTLREFYPVEEGGTIKCSECGQVICEVMEERVWTRPRKPASFPLTQ